MTVDLLPTDDGRSHFALGPVEKWVVGIGALAIVSVGGWFVNSVNAQQKTLQTLVTQQAVTNNQLTTISGQLLDIPAIRSQSVELKLRIDGLEEDVRELRQTKGLK